MKELTHTDLFHNLKEAYTPPNLNRICVTLISLYKNKQYGTLGQIAEMIDDLVEIEIDPEAKYFGKLMMLYHPDRGDFHRKEIDRMAREGDQAGLMGYAHILKLGKIEEMAENFSSLEDIDYSPVYEWDVNLEGFTVVGEPEPASGPTSPFRKKSNGYSFYNALKIRMYGDTKVKLPPHYLEDLDEIELSQSDINNLDGVQYCIHTLVMDLSGNSLTDISQLWGLTQLEELNLCDNRIEEIDTLSNLRNLRTIYLSNNAIRDISSLFTLSKLQYVELEDSKVPPHQIRELERMGITVVS